MTLQHPECTYDKAWVGPCGDVAIRIVDDEPRCEEHAGKTCGVCGAPATHQCPATFGLVCGAPLCEDHNSDDCTLHPT